MLINLSNHPSPLWSQEQIKTAGDQFGDVTDLPFPVVDPAGDEKYIQSLVDDYIAKIQLLTKDSSNVTVHIMGEMTFSFALVAALQKIGIKCVASTTSRVAVEGNGVKTSEFQFVKFREYARLQ